MFSYIKKGPSLYLALRFEAIKLFKVIVNFKPIKVLLNPFFSLYFRSRSQNNSAVDALDLARTHCLLLHALLPDKRGIWTRADFLASCFLHIRYIRPGKSNISFVLEVSWQTLTFVHSISLTGDHSLLDLLLVGSARLEAQQESRQRVHSVPDSDGRLPRRDLPTVCHAHGLPDR